MTRIGASQAFFNIVAQFNAEKLIKDTNSLNTVMKAVALDTFEAILKPVADLGQMLDGAIDAVRDLGMEMGDATVEFEKFYGGAGDLELVKDELIEIGEAYAMVGTEALAAGSRAAQVANLIGRQNVDLLVEQAAILAEISDLTLEEAQRGMIKLNQQAGILYGERTRQEIMSLSVGEQRLILTENSARALDTLNTIANRSVALEGDLVKTMTNFAAAAHLAGDSFEFMAASSAVLLEAGEEQGTAGRALRMIYARLGGDINGARTELEGMGFQLTESNGQMKTMQKVLEDLHTKGWGELNPAVKQNIAQTVAGNRHYVRFIKLMENYERVVSLTADGMEGLDSATKQAKKAMSSNVRQLQMAEAAVDNAKAAIGEGLTPMMIGAAEAERDFLQATEMLTDGMGGAGKMIGRFNTVMKVTGGFIKVGLAMQSVGIGLEMFTSVQRSLNGIEVAMANLHSKQASYLAYGTKATTEQKTLMDGMLYVQQKLNAANKMTQLTKGLTADSDKQLLENEKQRLAITEKLSERNKSLYHVQQEMGQLRKMDAQIGGKQLQTYDQMTQRLAYELSMNKELLAVQQDVYAKKGSERAYMMQMMADYKIIGAMGDKELETLNNKHKSLGRIHSALQQIKAQNEMIEGLRGKPSDTDRKGPNNITESAKLKNMLSQEDLNLVRQQIQEYAKWNSVSEETLNKQLKGNKISQEDYDAKMLVTRGVNQLTKSLEKGNEALEINGQGHRVLVDILGKVGGKMYQIDRLQRTKIAADKDEATMTKRLTNLSATRLSLERYRGNYKKQLQTLDNADANTKRNVLHLTEMLTQSEGNSAEQKRLMIDIIRQLTADENNLTGAMSKQRIEMIKQYATSEQYTTDKRKAAAATKQFNFAVSSAMGVLSGLVPHTKAAMFSMTMFGMQIVAAGKQMVVSAKKAFVTQTEMIYVQMQATRVRQIEQAAQAKGITLTQAEIAAQTRLISTKKAAMALSTLKLVSPMIALAAAVHLYTKAQEANKAEAEKFNKQLQITEATMGRFSGSAKIFGENEGLAKQLGISNYELKDLKGNSELTAQVLEKVSNHGLNLNTELSEAVGESKQLLTLLSSIQSGSNNKDLAQFESTLGDVLKDYQGIKGVGEVFSVTSWGKNSDLEKAKDFYETLPATVGKLSPATGKGLIEDIAQLMRQGYSLSVEQLDLVSDVLDNDAAMAGVRSMNALVLSTDEAAIAMNNLDENAAYTADGISDMATDMENLTQELYDFSGAREELFFGGQFGNVTGSLYKQVVQQGVGTLYHKNEVIMSNNFHGFFNEREAADKIIAVLDEWSTTNSNS